MVSDPAYPPYIELGGNLVLQQPYQSIGTRLYGFLFRGERRALRTLCDRALNSHAERLYDYIPLSSYFLVGFADLARGNPGRSPDREKGWTDERNAGIWLLTGAVRRGEHPKIERVASYIPYMFVDNPYSLAAGREVYGFPKVLGEFQMPAPHAADYFRVDTLGWSTYGPEEEARIQPVLEIRRTAERQSTRQASYQGEAREQSRKLFPRLGVLVRLFQSLRQREVPLVFLKQFRDASNGARACYQAIIEAPSQVVGWPKMGRLEGEYELLVHHLDSHPIGRDVGVPFAPQPLRARLAFWAEFDFIIQPGREVQAWRP